MHTLSLKHSMLDSLAGAKLFPAQDQQTNKNSIGHYKINVMPFGLTNASPTFHTNGMDVDWVIRCTAFSLHTSLYLPQHLRNI